MPRQPGRSDDTAIFIFGVQADRQALQALCDRTLNIRDAHGRPVHPDIEYLVVSPVVFLLFMKMERICSTHPQDSHKGLLREKELNVAIPLLVLERIAGVMLPTRMVWYMPYLWIDAGVAMASGRETFGFPKTMAQLTIPPAFGDPAVFAVEAEVWDPDHTSPPGRQLPIVNVRRIGGGNIESAIPVADFAQFTSGLFQWLQLPALAQPFLSFASWFDNTRFVFLKQFRDHTNGDDACYQAIVEVPVGYPGFHGAHWLAGAYEAELFHYASTPLAGELGFAGANPAGTVATQQTLFAGLINIDFVLGNGQTIWVAP